MIDFLNEVKNLDLDIRIALLVFVLSLFCIVADKLLTNTVYTVFIYTLAASFGYLASDFFL